MVFNPVSFQPDQPGRSGPELDAEQPQVEEEGAGNGVAVQTKNVVEMVQGITSGCIKRLFNPCDVSFLCALLCVNTLKISGDII